MSIISIYFDINKCFKFIYRILHWLKMSLIRIHVNWTQYILFKTSVVTQCMWKYCMKMAIFMGYINVWDAKGKNIEWNCVLLVHAIIIKISFFFIFFFTSIL